MAPIASFSGLASGIQWRDMIEQIVRLESTRRLTPVTTRIRAREAEKGDWGKYRDLLTAFGSAASKLQDGASLSVLQASAQVSPSTGRELLSVSASSTAQPGTYQVGVVSLASAQKVRAAAIADPAAALNYSGGFHVNGRAVMVDTADSLEAIRDKINAAGAGVTASILSKDASTHHLVLSADDTGSRGIELVDSTSNVLESLGVVTGTRVANLSADGTQAQTQRVSSTSVSLASALGASSPPSATTIDVNGTKVQVDLTTDTLVDLMDRINAAGGSASLVTETVGGEELTRLSVAGTVTADAGATDPAASQRVADLLGFERKAFATEAAAGADAEMMVDGLSITRRTNTISDVVAGVTFSLTAAEKDTTVEVMVERDQQAGVDAIKEFAKAYNDISQFLKDQRGEQGALHANGAVRSMIFSVRDVLISDVPGLSATNPYTRATLAGVSFDRDGFLQVDEAALNDALASDFTNVDEMFRGLGGELTGVTDPITDSIDGDIERQMEALDQSVSMLKDREADVRASLDRQREMMVARFVQMELALARIQSQGNWLVSQLQTLGPPAS